MRKDRFISDLKDLGANDRFQSTFLVQTKEVRQKKSGDPFLSMRLADRTGSLDSKMWDNVPAVAETFDAGDFVDVRGKVQGFNGHHQIIALRLRVIPEVQVYLGDFIPHTEFDIESMYAEALSTIEGFSDRNLKRLMSAIFRDPEFAARYKRAPAAAGMHHARIGGLLEHVLSVLKLAKLVASHYRDINSDLLACGVLLHDVGKIFELASDRSFEYTDEGRLLGHIAIGSAWLERRCDEIEGFPPRLKTLLLHMVLSHHGKKEYGSPQVPLFPEALALHFVDDLDSKLEIMRAARAEMPEGTIWSPYHKGMERFILDKGAFLRGERPSAGRRGVGSRTRGRKTPKPRRATGSEPARAKPVESGRAGSGPRRPRTRASGAAADKTPGSPAGTARAAKGNPRGSLEPGAAPSTEGQGPAHPEAGTEPAPEGRPERELKPPSSPSVASTPAQPPPPPLPRQPKLAGLEGGPEISE